MVGSNLGQVIGDRELVAFANVRLGSGKETDCFSYTPCMLRSMEHSDNRQKGLE